MKKILCAALAAMFIIAAPALTYAADLTDEQLGELGKYHILEGDENGNLNLDDNITRAEFAKMLGTALGRVHGFLYGSPTVDFSDVPQDHWALWFIDQAVELRFMEGDGDGNFRPDDNITYAEAVKSIVFVLGYESEAEARGGYPNGYMMQAARLGITDGVTCSTGDAAVRSDIARMIYNSLDIPFMQTVLMHGEILEYNVMDGSLGHPLKTLRTTLDVVLECYWLREE